MKRESDTAQALPWRGASALTLTDRTDTHETIPAVPPCGTVPIRVRLLGDDHYRPHPGARDQARPLRRLRFAHATRSKPYAQRRDAGTASRAAGGTGAGSSHRPGGNARRDPREFRRIRRTKLRFPARSELRPNAVHRRRRAPCPRHKVDANIEALFTKERPAGAGIHAVANRMDGACTRSSLPGSTTFRFYTSYAFRPDLLLNVRVENLLNRA